MVKPEEAIPSVLPQVVLPPAGNRRKARSTAIAIGLVFLVILFYLITIFKLGGAVLNRAM